MHQHPIGPQSHCREVATGSEVWPVQEGGVVNGHDQSGVLGQDQRCGEVGGVQQVRAALEETQGNLSMLPRRIDSGVDVREAGAGWGCPEVLPSVAVT